MTATPFPTPEVREFSFPCAPQTATRPARILLAEDDQEMRRLLAWTLRQEGYEVVEAENGFKLLDRLEPSFLDARLFGRILEFDLIISDLRMPGLTGTEVMAGLRAFDMHTPVVLITAFGDEEIRAEARELGITAVIDKPFDLATFISVLRELRPPVERIE